MFSSSGQVPVIKPRFRNIASHSEVLIASYNTAEALAEALSLTYNDDSIHENMLAVLGTVDLGREGLEA